MAAPLFASNPTRAGTSRQFNAFPEGYRPALGFGFQAAEMNADEWRNKPMSNMEYALAAKMALFQKQRDVAAKGQAMDAMQKLRMFQALRPDEIAGLYSRAPRNEREATAQDVIQNFTDAGDEGFDLGYRAQVANIKRGREDALFSRQIRDSDLRYGLLKDQSQREADRLDIAQERSDIQQQAEDRKQGQSDAITRRAIIKQAVESVATGSVHPEDVDRLFPELDARDRELVKSYGRQYRRDEDLGRSDANATAERYNQILSGEIQEARNRGTDLTGAFRNVNDLLMKDRNAQGAIRYDKAQRRYVSTLPAAEGPMFAPRRSINPYVSGASPSNPVATQMPFVSGPVAPRAQVSPMNQVFDFVNNSGNVPDPVIERLNTRGANAPIGSMVRNNGVIYIRDRTGWRRR